MSLYLFLKHGDITVFVRKTGIFGKVNQFSKSKILIFK